MGVYSLFFKVWEIGFPTTLKYSADLKEMLEWSLTQYAVFNKTDDYLLVCGVNINGPYYNEFFMGHGAIFDMTQGMLKILRELK